MAALSDYAEKLLLDWMMTTGAATRPTSWFVALFSSPTSDAAGGTEISGNGYARQPVTFAAAASPAGTTQNNVAVSFTASGGDWGTITHVAIVTAATGGNRLWHGPLEAERTVNDGDTMAIAAGALKMTMA